MRCCLGGWQVLCSLLIVDDAETTQEVLRLTSAYQSERRSSASQGETFQESLCTASLGSCADSTLAQQLHSMVRKLLKWQGTFLV